MSADPFLTRLDRYRVAAADPKAWDDIPGKSDPATIMLDELASGAVVITSPTAAAAALRYVLDDNCIVDGLSTAMVRSVLAFLEGSAGR